MTADREFTLPGVFHRGLTVSAVLVRPFVGVVGHVEIPCLPCARQQHQHVIPLAVRAAEGRDVGYQVSAVVQPGAADRPGCVGWVSPDSS